MVSVNRYNIQHVIFDGNYVSDVQLDNQSIWSTSLVPKFYTWEKPYLRNLFSPVDDNDAETTITRDGLSYRFLKQFRLSESSKYFKYIPLLGQLII